MFPRLAPRLFARCPRTPARVQWYLRPLLALIGLLLLLPSLRAQASEVVRLSNSEWPPYFSETQKHDGIGSHIVSEAFALEGVRVEYQFFPARRALELAKNGTFDGTVGWELNEERSRYLIASDVVWESPWVFFHRVTTPFDWSDLASLRYHRIGGTVGYMYTPEFREAETAGIVTLDRGPSDDVGFRKLLAGRFELFPQLREVGYYQIRQLFSPQQQRLFTHHEKPFGSHRDQLLIYRHHPRSQALIDAFNRGLAKLRDSGQLERYFDALARGEYNLEPNH
ncbi:substrate-binding periplasmic protein [Aestuariirhabdus litorea]|uniref:Amino acid ABC transporter substrate-binding protein n=1 Tax=Aestuariirhabdus litorea TaxID=2528527 RepID=A0A3P3VMZ8_9GAMM|nr:transporter substrate-binding domain-containing protein [Aestuariirhabdus litorea]RRJ83980.1 amino acid ABC transporter substrate-binding protein [Aestuariirhabdus litorea]RWW97200.1 transporter substrate-binding domain-containing protein [Endozoicomonadaceae bacterium GTF-13]